VGPDGSGAGLNHLQESMSVLGVHTMSKNSFMATERAVGKWWWDILEESMKAAGEEEWRIAIQKSSYHKHFNKTVYCLRIQYFA